MPQQRPKSPFCKMVLVKDNSGKFYRQRSQEQNMNTERKNTPSQNIKRPQIPFLKCKDNKENKGQAKLFTASGHRRGETRDLGVTQGDKTKRNNGEITHIPPFLNSPKMANRAQSKGCQALQDRVPRGNIYIQKGEQVQRGKGVSEPQWQQNNSSGDSKLSIQLGLGTVKSSRRLNYDIYLSEQS